MILLGIDPGTALTGYALVELPKRKNAKLSLVKSGVISTPAKTDMHLRLNLLYEGLNEIGKEYSPEIMVVERLFFNTNVKTALSVGQARGVVLLVAALQNMKVVEYTALQAKKVLAGYGRANKKEMQEAVRKHMSLKEIIKPDDANDAVAMAICYYQKEIIGEI
jgi:crossover junction endodeoxyribonuclease RuvC